MKSCASCSYAVKGEGHWLYGMIMLPSSKPVSLWQQFTSCMTLLCSTQMKNTTSKHNLSSSVCVESQMEHYLPSTGSWTGDTYRRSDACRLPCWVGNKARRKLRNTWVQGEFGEFVWWPTKNIYIYYSMFGQYLQVRQSQLSHTVFVSVLWIQKICYWQAGRIAEMCTNHQCYPADHVLSTSYTRTSGTLAEGWHPLNYTWSIFITILQHMEEKR